MNGQSPPRAKNKAGDKQDLRARALRDNLRKRKAQSKSVQDSVQDKGMQNQDTQNNIE